MNFNFDVPRWFIQWWEQFGPIPEILPPLVSESFNIFKNKFSPTSEQNYFPHLLLFFANFNLSWIVSWHYTIFNISINDTNESKNDLVLPCLGRKFQVKWWDQFQYSHATPNAVNEWFQKHPAICSTIGAASQFLLAKSQNQSILASATSQEEYRNLLLQCLSQVDPIAFHKAISGNEAGSTSKVSSQGDNEYIPSPEI